MNKNPSQLIFNKTYFILAMILFVIEVLIGLYVNDRFIRPYGGDFLVVILLYFLLRAFWNQKPLVIAIVVLVFSFCVEIAQYFKIVEILGLQGNRLAEIIIGTSFAWHDLLAYTLGVLLVYLLDVRNVFTNS